jgi:hypothetical protein
LFFLTAGGKTPDVGARTYKDIMQERELQQKQKEVFKLLIRNLRFIGTWAELLILLIS